jgi:putative flippase GtrA
VRRFIERLDPSGEKTRFLVVGAWNTVFSMGVLWLLDRYVPYDVSSVSQKWLLLALSWAIGVTHNFFTFKLLVFRTRGRWLREYARMYVTYAATFVVQSMLTLVLSQAFGLRLFWANLPTIVVVTVMSYLGHKYFTFRGAREMAAETVDAPEGAALAAAEGPLVTIGIPAFRSAVFIEQAVRSALAQTYVNLEVLVIDDASDDGTLDVLSGLGDPRLRILRNAENLGAVGNWNRVLAEARGEFVKVLHSDDFIEPEAIARQVAPMLAEPGVVLVSSRRRIVDRAGSSVTVRGARWTTGRRDGRATVREMARAGRNMIGEPTATLLRADALAKAGGFDAAYGYCVDLDLWARLLSVGDLYFIHEPLASFRVSPDQWSVRLADQQAGDMVRLLQKLERDPTMGVSGADVRAGARSAGRQASMRRILYRVLALRGRLSARARRSESVGER